MMLRLRLQANATTVGWLDIVNTGPGTEALAHRPPGVPGCVSSPRPVTSVEDHLRPHRARRSGMAYLIEHTAACDCQDREAAVRQTPRDVAVYLWGRDVRAHVVYAGECPYRLFTGDLRLIEALLEECPVATVRPFLPCSFWAGSQPLVAIGECSQRADGTLQLFR